MITFKTDPFTSNYIKLIADRAVTMAAANQIEYDGKEAQMDLLAAHLNGCPLNLAKLLHAPDEDFGHDIFGIRRFLDRDTAKINPAKFDPRCSMPIRSKITVNVRMVGGGDWIARTKTKPACQASSTSEAAIAARAAAAKHLRCDRENVTLEMITEPVFQSPGSYRAFERACRICGCTDADCQQCVHRTGERCRWVGAGLCSACTKY